MLVRTRTLSVPVAYTSYQFIVQKWDQYTISVKYQPFSKIKNNVIRTMKIDGKSHSLFILNGMQTNTTCIA